MWPECLHYIYMFTFWVFAVFVFFSACSLLSSIVQYKHNSKVHFFNLIDYIQHLMNVAPIQVLFFDITHCCTWNHSSNTVTLRMVVVVNWSFWCHSGRLLVCWSQQVNLKDGVNSLYVTRYFFVKWYLLCQSTQTVCLFFNPTLNPPTATHPSFSHLCLYFDLLSMHNLCCLLRC